MGRITLVVHLHTLLRRPGEQPLRVQAEAGQTLAGLARQLELSLSPAHLLLVVNGRNAAPEQSLADGDVVHFIPALEGG